MQLQRLDAHGLRLLGGVDKVFFDLLQVGLRHGGWRGLLWQMGQGAGGQRLPAAVLWRDQHAAVPRGGTRGLAARVADLDAHRHVGRQAPGALQLVAEGIGRGVVPQAQASGADAAFGRDGRGLQGQHARAAVEQVGPVRQVPVVGLAVNGRVLAHGRHDDAVGQGEGATGGVESEGSEKQAHAAILGMQAFEPIRCVTRPQEAFGLPAFTLTKVPILRRRGHRPSAPGRSPGGACPGAGHAATAEPSRCAPPPPGSAAPCRASRRQ